MYFLQLVYYIILLTMSREWVAVFSLVFPILYSYYHYSNIANNYQRFATSSYEVFLVVFFKPFSFKFNYSNMNAYFSWFINWPDMNSCHCSCKCEIKTFNFQNLNKEHFTRHFQICRRNVKENTINLIIFD